LFRKLLNMRKDMNKIPLIFLLIVITLFSCQKRVAVELLSEKEPLAIDQRVVFLEDNQSLPESAEKIGELTFNKTTSTASDEFYNSMIKAKEIARESGANVVKAEVSADEQNSDTPIKLNMYKYEGDVVALIVREAVEEKVDSIYSYVFLESCSLTTSSSSRQWCTQLSIRTALLQHYTYPEITDSSTFEKGEIYELIFDINSNGKITRSEVLGGSNKILAKAINDALIAADLRFAALQLFEDGQVFSCSMIVGSYEFLTLVRGDMWGSPQAPQAPTEDQLLFSVRKNKNK